MATEHVEELSKDKSHKKGCTVKCEPSYKKAGGHSYRYNGHEELKANHKDVYNLDFTLDENQKRLPFIYQEFRNVNKGGKDNPSNWKFTKNPTTAKNKKAWWIETDSNFKKNYLPYGHDSHHILPMESLHSAFEDDTKKLKLLQMAGYNLNHGINIIILPKMSEYGVAMKLPSHPYDHEDYRKKVKTEIQKFAKKVKKDKKAHAKGDPSKYTEIKNDIENWERTEFKAIVKYGTDVIAKLDPNKPLQPCQINKCPVAKATIKK